MKPITEERHQELIEFIRAAQESMGGNEPVNPNKFDIEKMTPGVFEIALASLTAKPACVTDIQDIEDMKIEGWIGNFMAPDFQGVDTEDRVYLFTAPPVPVIELPNDTCLLAQFARIYSALSIREHRHITRMVLNEVKRLNGLE